MKCLIIYIIVLNIFFFSGCDWFKRRSVKSRISKTKYKTGTYHYLKPGETLWNISKNTGIDIDILLKINNIQNPKKIRVGTRIYIPSSNYRNTSKVFYHSKKKKRVIKRPVPKDNSDSGYRKVVGKFIFPINSGKITRTFHSSKGTYYDGIDLSMNKSQPVYAIEDGMVEYNGNDMEGFGTTVIISHSDDYYSLYAFLGKTDCEIGQSVKKGKIIGYTSKPSIKSKNYLLHFQFRKGVIPQNPLKYYSKNIVRKYQ